MDSSYKSELRRLDALFSGSSRIGLAVHVHPDGDALGSAVAFVGLFTALASDAAAASLAGFGIMGVGLAPIVPILFSCAGAAGDPVRAASFLSSLAYGGMLCFPPMLGFVAHATSVGTALVIVLGLAAAILAGSFILRRRLGSPSS